MSTHSGFTSSPQPPSRTRWLIFSLASVTSWFLYLHRYTWNIVAPYLKDQLGWDNSQTQTAYAMFNVTYGLGQLPSGILCDFLGPHYFLASSIALWSATVPCYTWFTSQIALYSVRLLFGMAQAGCYPCLSKVTQVWFPPTYRTSIQGWIATFFGRSGGALSTIILGTLLLGYCKLSMGTALMLMAAGGIAFSAVFLWLFQSRPESDPRVNQAELDHIQQGRNVTLSSEGQILSWSTALRNRSLWFLMIQQFLIAGADTSFQSLTGGFFLSKKLDMTQVGWLASLPLWGGAIGGILGGMVNDALLHGHRRRLVTLTTLLGLVLGGFIGVVGVLGISQENFLSALPGLFQTMLIGGSLGILAGWLLLPLSGKPRWCRSVLGATGSFLASGLVLLVSRQEQALAAGLVLFCVKYFADMQQPTQWGACTDVGGRFSATVFAMVNTAGNAGGVVFPILFGLLLDWNTTDSGGASVTNYAPLFLMLAGMYAVGALCWLFTDSTSSLDQTVTSQEQ